MSLPGDAARAEGAAAGMDLCVMMLESTEGRSQEGCRVEAEILYGLELESLRLLDLTRAS